MARQLKYASSSVESVSSAVTVYGTADAVGENTLATADISLKVSEKNQGTKIKGEVTTTAVATSSDGDGVYASAQTGVEFSGVDKSSALTGRSAAAAKRTASHGRPRPRRRSSGRSMRPVGSPMINP